MNIAMYHCRLPTAGRKPGGAEVYVDRLATALAQRGHHVVVWTYSGPSTAPIYDVMPLRPKRVAQRKLLRQYVGPWLLNGLDLDDFDVFHLFGDDWFYFRRNLPTVRTFLGSAVFESATATSWKRRIDQRLLFMLEQVSARLATSSYGIGLDSELLYGGQGTLPSGIDASTFKPHQPAAEPTLLFVGTWEGRKRGAFLHEVFEREIRTRLPNARLWMVCDKAPASDGVEWFAHPSDEELDELYSRAWVFCLPSRYEGFGLPYLEAAAHGLAVVSTPNPGALSLLGMSDDGQAAGAVVSDDALGATLVRLLKDAALRETLGWRARARADEFSWDRVVTMHERAYATALGRHAPR